MLELSISKIFQSALSKPAEAANLSPAVHIVDIDIDALTAEQVQ